MESTKHSVSRQISSTQFPQSSTHCYFSTQQAGYMGQQPLCTNLFGQFNNLYHSSDILTASPFLDKREVILREIEKERIRAQAIVSEIEKMHVLEREINKDLSQVEAAKLRVKNQKPGNLKNDQERTIQGVQKNGDPKKTTCNFWCEMCQVRTSSRVLMNDHEKGKKHLRRLKEIVQKGETGEGNKKENIEVLLNYVEHVPESEKSLLSCNFDVVMDEARLELQNPVDASASRFETLPCQIRSADRRVSEFTPLTKNGNEEGKINCVDNHDATIFGSKLKAVTLPIADASECPSEDDAITVKGIWSDLCQVFSITVSALNEFLLGRNKKLKEASSKTPPPGRDSSKGNIAADTSLPKETESLEILSNNVDVVSAEARLELEKRLDTSEIGFETSLIQFGTVDLVVSKVKPIAENGKEEEIVQKGESDPCIEKEKINKRDKHICEFGKSILSNNVDVVSAEARLELEKPLDTSEIGLETSLIQFGTVDLIVSEVKPIAEEDKIVQNSESEPCIEKEKIKESMNCDKHISEGGKGIFSNNVGEISAESRLKRESLLDTSDNGSETSLIQFQIVDLKVSNVKPVVESDNKEESILVVNPDADSSKYPSDIILHKNFEGERSCVESALTEQLCGKKLKLKKASLKSQSPGKNSNIGTISRDTLPMKKTDLLENPESDNFRKDPSAQKKGDLKKKKDNFEILSVQIEAVDLRVPEVKPIMRNDKNEENVFVANLDANKSGYKCKALTPTALKDMCEKKHKLKEDSLKPQSPGKNCGIGNFLCDALLSKETELLVNLKSDNYKKDHMKTIQSVQNNGYPKMTNYVFSHEKNQVGTSSDKVVHDEEKGRKQNEIVRNGETVPCDHKEKSIEHVNHVKHISKVGKFIFPHILAKQDAKAAGVDITKSGHGSTLHAFSPKDGEINAQGEWNCALCEVIAPTESSLNEHLSGKKHKLKEASLKTQGPGNDSNMGNVPTVTLLEYSKSDNTINDNAKANRSVGKNGDLKKTVTSWCEGRQVGPSEKVTYNLEKEKESAEIDECKPCNHKGGMEVSVDCVEHVSEREKSIFSEMFGQVIATNESPLNKHLCGEKQILNEASLKTQRPGNNSALLEYPKSDSIKEDHAKTIKSAGKNVDVKKTKYSYRRRSCQVGPLEKVTYNLEKGKEHAETDKRGSHNEEKMEVHVNCVAHVSESEKFSGVVSGQARLEFPKPLDVTNNGGHKHVKRSKRKKKADKKIKD